MAERGLVTPALAAVGFFGALALMATVLPLRRAVAEIGRMGQAARRVGATLQSGTPETSRLMATADALNLQGVTFRRPGAARAVQYL